MKVNKIGKKRLPICGNWKLAPVVELFSQLNILLYTCALFLLSCFDFSLDFRPKKKDFGRSLNAMPVKRRIANIIYGRKCRPLFVKTKVRSGPNKI